MSHLAAFIQQRMDTLGIANREELSRRTGISRSHVDYLFLRDKPIPREPTVRKLAEGLKVTPEQVREAAGLRVERVDDGSDPEVEALLMTVRDLSPEAREQWKRWAKFAAEQVAAEQDRREDTEHR